MSNYVQNIYIPMYRICTQTDMGDGYRPKIPEHLNDRLDEPLSQRINGCSVTVNPVEYDGCMTKGEFVRRAVSEKLKRIEQEVKSDEDGSN